MCGRITLATWDEVQSLADALGVDVSDPGDVTWAADARPGDRIPAFITHHHPDQAQTPSALHLASFTWGYELSSTSKLVYNARIENAERPLWATSFAHGRALVPVAAFFEPHRSETQRHPLTGRKAKRSYQFEALAPSLLLLGAITSGSRISIVTTEPNERIASVHPRMPVVVPYERTAMWWSQQWPSCADCSDVALSAFPEFPETSEPEQLSLSFDH